MFLRAVFVFAIVQLILAFKVAEVHKLQEQMSVSQNLEMNPSPTAEFDKVCFAF